MPSSKYKYCPFCGAHIPQHMMIKYCPFCGENILVDTNIVEVHDEKILSNEVLKEFCIDNDRKKKMEKFIDSEYYSIVLKDAPNKQGLVRKLEKVLLRGYFAIRLAVDNIPSIIIYKARSHDVRDLSQIFRDEQASVSIIEGDFNNKPPVGDICSFLDKLNMETRQFIENMPINLWLGDSIQGIFPSTYKEQTEGALVITDKNLYFIYKDTPGRKDQWFAKSYNLLSKVVMRDNYLELISTNMSITSITFSNNENLSDAYQCIQRAIQL